MHKPRFVVCALLAVLLFSCSKSETPAPVRMRAVEPRLSGDWSWQSCVRTLPAGHVVEIAQCGAHIAAKPVSLSAEGCDDMTGTPQQTIEILASRPACTDAAVVALERVARGRTDADVLSDLSAAYYVRAQRQDRPKDLLESLHYANAALRRAPRHARALFNRALTLEALSLGEDVLVAWDSAASADQTQWAVDAKARRNKVADALTRRASVQWPLLRANLPRALAAGDRQTIERVTGYPGAARQYVEDELLPEWAESQSAVPLTLAKAIATTLAERKGDRYLLDVVETIEHSRNDARRRTLLRDAHSKFGKARAEDRKRNTNGAAPLYREAVRMLSSAGSPLEYSAAAGLAVNTSYGGQEAKSVAILNQTIAAARVHRYQQLEAWLRASRAFVLTADYAEAMADYRAGLLLFEPANDVSEVAKMYNGLAGIERIIGLREQAWRHAYQSLRLSDAIVDAQHRHRIRGEAAALVAELRFPDTALLYQDQTVAMIRQELAKARTGTSEASRLTTNLIIALRARAGMEVELQNFNPARKDLGESNGLLTEELEKREGASAKDVRRSLQARIDEVEGQIALGRKDMAAAIAAFTRALNNGPRDEYRTFRVRLFTQRADARRLANDVAGAEADMRQALEALNAEESRMLEGGKRAPQTQEMWNIYFSRFTETYDRLIRQLTEQGRDEDAFNYAERARAVEPLSLLLRLQVVPPEFRALTKGETLSLEKVRAQLPAGTFLLQYRVTSDRTYAWVISRDAFKAMTLPVKWDDIDVWTRTLQGAALNRPKIFNAGLSAPYETLLRQPLEIMQQLPGWRDPKARLVIIPDGPMHGLPFAALQDLNRQYLVEKAPLSVDASATLYVFSLLRDRGLAGTNADTALLVGDPAFDKTTGLKSLPAAAAGIAAIRAIYPRGESLQGAGATIDRFFDAAQSSTIIHFAGHALTDAERPSASKLLFAKAGQSNGELTATALLQNAKLDRTRLVVLAACSSAGGAPVGADGLAPLVRPFVAAGVSAVVGTLWDVTDTTAEPFLLEFHKHFRKGLDAASALREAQLTALRDSKAKTNSPLTWAAFQVIGHSTSPFAPTTQ